MGGCFAQNEDASSVDTFWPSEKVAVPVYTAAASIGLFQYDDVPVGVDFDDCYVYTRQTAITRRSGEVVSGVVFFAVFQGNNATYNCYFPSTHQSLEIAYRSKDFVNLRETKYVGELPREVVFKADSSGASVPLYNVSVPGSYWDSSLPGRRLLILDARASEKDFYVSYGQWGHKWCLLPMKSATQAEAVFDFAMKILVEF